MEFFDDAINKTKEVFGVVSKKTGDAFNIGRLKYEIATLENKKDKDFIELGKLYFELFENGLEVDESAVGTVESIKEKNAKIAELNTFLQAVKNRIVCPKCGANIENGSVFCNACGEKIEK